jgi:membrane peptidoglycan carboxypeptidase
VSRPVSHAGVGAGVKAIAMLAVLALVAGVLSAIALLPLVGVAGITVRDAAKTFNDLPVKGLSEVPSRSELVDSSGHLLAYYYPGFPRPIYRVPVPYNQISPLMRQAIVSIEDSRFWTHGALDVRGTFRAISLDLSGRAVQGGSDLAQQYVKNACILTAHTAKEQAYCASDTLSRKITELRTAALVEHQMTKEELLTSYLNVAYFENQAYGVQVAAQRYFSTSAKHLTLTESAMLAGLVENPVGYDPLTNPKAALARRATVLQQMQKLGYITKAELATALKAPLGLKLSSVPLQTGCVSPSVQKAAYFCDYVLAAMRHDKAYKKAYSELTTTGGLKIYTTLNMKDQLAADKAVFYVLPHNNYANPNHDVDAEVMVQPKTGYIKAIAINRHYGFGKGLNSIDYAVDSPYNGGAGVQTGSSSKLFTLVAALKQGIPFGYTLTVHDNEFAGPLRTCKGRYVPPWQVHNADGGESGKIPLYFGTTASINAFYASLEARVGLCNVVKTAISLGLKRASGISLLKFDPNLPKGNNYPADYIPSFTLGAVYVSPLDMATSYATVASGGIQCHSIAITKITDSHGRNMPVESANCHRALSKGVANAANYVLSGVLTNGGGTATDRGIGRPAAAKTGTANSGYYAAFAGYTPTLVGYSSVFNPEHPTRISYTGQPGAMLGCPEATFRAYPGGYVTCPGQMFGDNAPGATWEYSFLRAALGKPLHFGPVPGNYFSLGTGASPPAPPKPPKKKGGGGGNGGGGNGGGGGGGH